MTKIKRIVMKGFKSFGNRTELVFGDTFNCVLGPNGSGKSNIMDAMCFVLGKGSAKGLRAERAANLIYNGGKTKQPAKQGEVHIYFDNSKKKFPSDDSEVKISRIIRQNGQSTYKINDKKRTRQQILDILGLANIDPDGYNIILQGDIVRFVEMSPINRREVMEEIAGIGSYEDKKNKALNELVKVEQKLNEAEIILNERKSYLKELKKDRDHALKYREMNDQINRNKATFLHMQTSEKAAEKEKFDEIIKNHEEEIKKLKEKVEMLKACTAEKKKLLADITLEIEEKGEKEQIAVLKEVEKLKVGVGTDKNRIISCRNEIERICARREQMHGSMKDVQKKIGELEVEKAENEKAKTAAEKVLAQVTAKIAAFRRKNKLDGAEDIDRQIESVDRQSEEKQKIIQELRESQQNLLREKDRLEFQINSIDERVAKVIELEKEHKAEIEKLKQSKMEFKKASLELSKLLNDDSSMALQLSNAKNKLNAARDDFSRLKSAVAAIGESIGTDIAVSKVLSQNGRLGDIYGIVSQLGNVEAKYSLALEIAAGPKIKSVVVETDKTAASCIKYLKQNKFGIATFLPMNKLKPVKEGQNTEEYKKIKGVHGSAIDLISFEPKFRNVFSYVFGNTLIVENIDVARRIGVGNARMVTLDGDMAELSGAMHGGFRKKERGLKFQEKEAMAQVKALEKEIADNENIVSVLEKRRADNEGTITGLRGLKATLEGEIIKTEKSLHLDSEDVGATKNLKKELRQKADLLDKDAASLNTKITAVNKELAELKIKKQQLRDKVMQLRNPRLIAELNTFEQKKSQLNEEIIKHQSNAKNLGIQVSNILSPECQNTLKIIRQLDKEEAGFKKEIDDLNEKIKTDSNILDEKEKKQAVFYNRFKELFSEKDKLNQGLQKVESEIVIKEEKIISAEEKMNFYSVGLAKAKAELSVLDDELSKYKDVELFKSKTKEDIKRDIAAFERMVADIGSVNLKALEVYDAVENEYNKLLEKKETLVKEKDEVLVMINAIETKKKDLFMKTFNVVNENFQKMFLSLSTKGEAFLDVENQENPFAEGVGIKVRITGKKFLDIRGLSGGEKTLTALAFIFAIQEHEPASFYVFDEVDASLDKKNSEKLSQLINTYSKNAQYIIISHNDGVISEADTLYGVTMDAYNMSKVVSLKI